MELREKILGNPAVWRVLRKIQDLLFGLYSKRIAVIRNFGITDVMSVIDVACGTGQYSAITKADYLGVDLNEKYINDATKTYGTAKRKFLCADANTAAIKESSYDAAILIDATHHLSDQENKTLLATLGRVASKYVIICDPVIQKPANLIGRFLTYVDRGNYIRPRQALLDVISSALKIEKVADLKMMGIESICILARPQK